MIGPRTKYILLSLRLEFAVYLLYIFFPDIGTLFTRFALVISEAHQSLNFLIPFMDIYFSLKIHTCGFNGTSQLFPRNLGEEKKLCFFIYDNLKK